MLHNQVSKKRADGLSLLPGKFKSELIQIKS